MDDDDESAIAASFTLPDDLDGSKSPAVIADRLQRDPEHAHIRENDLRILWLMRSGIVIQAGRQILGSVHEPMVQGKLRDLFACMLVRTYGYMPDFIITIDAGWWADATPIQREALVWHEMAHIKQATDKHGEPRFDRDGNPVFAIKGHDLEEFNSTVMRYGAWKEDVESFIKAATNG